eukprot:m.110327 g.110327  ORF g.110327 m.110327 type:complete len:755 (-) comp14326_c0_seq9:76-2340(-)
MFLQLLTILTNKDSLCITLKALVKEERRFSAGLGAQEEGGGLVGEGMMCELPAHSGKLVFNFQLCPKQPVLVVINQDTMPRRKAAAKPNAKPVLDPEELAKEVALLKIQLERSDKRADELQRLADEEKKRADKEKERADAVEKFMSAQDAQTSKRVLAAPLSTSETTRAENIKSTHNSVLMHQAFLYAATSSLLADPSPEAKWLATVFATGFLEAKESRGLFSRMSDSQRKAVEAIAIEQESTKKKESKESKESKKPTNPFASMRHTANGTGYPSEPAVTAVLVSQGGRPVAISRLLPASSTHDGQPAAATAAVPGAAAAAIPTTATPAASATLAAAKPAPAAAARTPAPVQALAAQEPTLLWGHQVVDVKGGRTDATLYHSNSLIPYAHVEFGVSPLATKKVQMLTYAINSLSVDCGNEDDETNRAILGLIVRFDGQTGALAGFELCGYTLLATASKDKQSCHVAEVSLYQCSTGSPGVRSDPASFTTHLARCFHALLMHGAHDGFPQSVPAVHMADKHATAALHDDFVYKLFPSEPTARTVTENIAMLDAEELPVCASTPCGPLIRYKYIPGKPFPTSVAQVRAVVSHLSRAHERKVAHGDIRGFNMVFNWQTPSESKLIDWDLAGREGTKRYPVGYRPVSDGFRHPEAQGNALLTLEHDCFSLGKFLAQFSPSCCEDEAARRWLDCIKALKEKGVRICLELMSTLGDDIKLIIKSEIPGFEDALRGLSGQSDKPVAKLAGGTHSPLRYQAP